MEGVRVAWQALSGNRTRSLLTVLGVAVGVAVVVMIAALVTGIRTSVMSGFEAAGPKNFVVMRWDLSAVQIGGDGTNRVPWWNRPPLEPEHAEVVDDLQVIDEALFHFPLSVAVDREGRRFSGVQALAYSSGWPRYSAGDFVAGRDFIPAEVRQSRAVVVLSEPLAEDIFGPLDPIDRRVGLGVPWRRVREEFTVIGVYRPEQNIFSSVEPKWAVIPHTAATKRLKASDRHARILVVPRDSVSQARAMEDVTGALRGLRGLGPREENDFSLLRSDQIIELFNRLTGVFFLVMIALSSVGLMVGGVGVIGIMLISVTERTREIGIRKAVGATRREILWQFLVEASMLTIFGAAVGLATGIAAAEAVETYSPVPASIPVWAIAAGLGMAALTGLVFGLLPAYRAARMEPTDALRFE